MAIQHEERARALVGTPFRPQGREPRLGLDCIGLIAVSFGLPLEHVARDYRLRGDHWKRIESGMDPFFRLVPRKQAQAGDVLLFAVARDQWHVAVKTSKGFVHADARLRKAVETPGDAPWPLARVFRRRVRPKRRG